MIRKNSKNKIIDLCNRKKSFLFPNKRISCKTTQKKGVQPP